MCYVFSVVWSILLDMCEVFSVEFLLCICGAVNSKILCGQVKAYIRRGKRYQAFQAWRKKKAEARRHQMLRYWEGQVGSC